MGRARAFTAKVVMPRGKPTGQVGTFNHETTSQSKLLREAGGKFPEWRAPFASCIAGAQIAGEIDSTFDPADLAEFLPASLEGRNSSYEGRTWPGRARSLQEHHFPNCIQGEQK